MPRIRTVKPEFWEDETIGLLSVHARLLFIATWNLADDEGLLRWSPAYIKASVFMYDDIGLADVQRYMAEVVDNGLLFPYRGGKTQQELAYIVRFRRHQKINRPQPGKLPPPSLQNPKVRDMYAARDGWVCHLCGREILDAWVHGGRSDGTNLQIDHLEPRANGGSDYPSNLAAAHETCNKRRHTKPLPGSVNEEIDDPDDVLPDSLSDSVNDSLPNSVSDSVAEGNREQGEEGKGTGSREGEREGEPATPTSATSAGSAPDPVGPDRADAPPEPAQVFEIVEHPEARRLCNLLADSIAEWSGQRPTVGKRWVTAARLMLDRDGLTVEQVEYLIRWVTDSEFWRPNVLSMPKLREKRITLIGQIQAGRDHGGGISAIDRARAASVAELLEGGGAS